MEKSDLVCFGFWSRVRLVGNWSSTASDPKSPACMPRMEMVISVLMEDVWMICQMYGGYLRGRHLHVAELEGPPTAAAGEHDHEVPPAARGVAQAHVEAGLLLQERQEGHLPGDDHPQPLHMALQRQDHTLHGQVSDLPFTNQKYCIYSNQEIY
ncbi:uncharacterized protein CDAR_568101 [Caerostris darwini]|uniref:Uncharacterized protein n=1 Tax=Caerostris darwini TaxID=1538125 RepID=A0AAV4PL24_9ARAC|nr:uncharacterized protein CDAR_568101 [Caerostris darwini]